MAERSGPSLVNPPRLGDTIEPQIIPQPHHAGRFIIALNGVSIDAISYPSEAAARAALAKSRTS